MWRQVVAQSPGKNAPSAEVLRYDVGWKALNTMLKSGRSLSGHERNCCFLNTAGQRFADISAASSLDFDDDGRVLALTDWDQDGDLDFWIANRTGPQVRFMRNDAANEHHFIAFKLQGVHCNRDAIGSRLELKLANSEFPLRIKTLRAGEGYLGQSSKWLHFGLGSETQIDHVTVKWPDGTQERISGLSANRRYQIKQSTGVAQPVDETGRRVDLTPSTIEVPPSTDKSRIVLISPLPLPSITYEASDAISEVSLATPGQAKLINLWATWCQPCLEELTEWKSHTDEFRKAGIQVVAINVDEPVADRERQRQTIRSLLDAMELPFDGGFGTASLVNQFDVLQRAILRRQQPLPVPSSFLVDARGNLRVIYKGPIDATQVLMDAKLLDASEEEIVAASVPYEGIWLGQPAGTSPNVLAVRFVEGGFITEAENYIRRLAAKPVDNPMYNPAEAMVLLGAICSDQGRYDEAAHAFLAALEANPHHLQSHIELAGVLVQQDKPAAAVKHFQAALERKESDPELRMRLALALSSAGEHESARAELEKSIAFRPTPLAYHHLGNTLIALGRLPEAVANFEKALALQPSLSVAANNLAWLLATNESTWNPERALELAKTLIASETKQTPGNLDTIAAAYAAAGQYDKAVQNAREAIRLAKADGELATAQRIQRRLALYRRAQPYRE